MESLREILRLVVEAGFTTRRGIRTHGNGWELNDEYPIAFQAAGSLGDLVATIGYEVVIELPIGENEVSDAGV